MRPGYLLAVTVAVSFFSTSGSAAEPLRGAAEVLKRVAGQSGSPAPGTKSPSESARLRADLTNFTRRAVSLAPAVAAREWLHHWKGDVLPDGYCLLSRLLVARGNPPHTICASTVDDVVAAEMDERQSLD